MTSPDTMSRPAPSSPNSVARSREPNPFDELRRDQDRAGHPTTLDKKHLRRCLLPDTPRNVGILCTLAADGRYRLGGSRRLYSGTNSRMYPAPVNRTMKSNSLASAPGRTRALFLATAFRMTFAARCGLVIATF